MRFGNQNADFLQELVDQPTLLACGPVYSEHLTFFHNGERWILNAEAEAKSIAKGIRFDAEFRAR